MRVITINEDTGKRVYSRQEIADLCGVSTQTIRLWENAGRIPASIRDENDYRWWEADVLDQIMEYAKNPVKCGRKSKPKNE
jgi:predicted site-specific integrase-resolvase